MPGKSQIYLHRLKVSEKAPNPKKRELKKKDIGLRLIFEGREEHHRKETSARKRQGTEAKTKVK